MLLYIAIVLDNYEKELDDPRGNRSTLPGPRITELNFRDRTLLPNVFKKYILTFEYELVELNKYRREDLIEFADVLSFIMHIDTLKPKEGIEALQGLPKEYLEELRLKISERRMTRLCVNIHMRN
jgi:hypothetical protein